MTPLPNKLTARCCLPGGACYEAGLADVQHKVEPLVARIAQALSDSAKASWDRHKVRDDWHALACAALSTVLDSAAQAKTQGYRQKMLGELSAANEALCPCVVLKGLGDGDVVSR